jgi:hypothetical protein
MDKSLIPSPGNDTVKFNMPHIIDLLRMSSFYHTSSA